MMHLYHQSTVGPPVWETSQTLKLVLGTIGEWGGGVGRVGSYGVLRGLL